MSRTQSSPSDAVEGRIEIWAQDSGRLGITARYAIVLEKEIAKRNALIGRMLRVIRDAKSALYEYPQDNWVDLICDCQNAINQAVEMDRGKTRRGAAQA